MFIRDLLSALAVRHVPYCVVGGVAVNLHGVPRMTYDVDLVVVSPPIAPSELVHRAVTLRLDDLSVSVIGIHDLIALKRASARPQDLADIKHLERLAEEPG